MAVTSMNSGTIVTKHKYKYNWHLCCLIQLAPLLPNKTNKKYKYDWHICYQIQIQIQLASLLPHPPLPSPAPDLDSQCDRVDCPENI